MYSFPFEFWNEIVFPHFQKFIFFNLRYMIYIRLVLFIVHYPNKEPFMQSKCFYTLSLHMHGSACRNCTQIKSKIEIDYSICKWIKSFSKRVHLFLYVDHTNPKMSQSFQGMVWGQKLNSIYISYSFNKRKQNIIWTFST